MGNVLGQMYLKCIRKVLKIFIDFCQVKELLIFKCQVQVLKNE